MAVSLKIKRKIVMRSGRHKQHDLLLEHWPEKQKSFKHGPVM